MACGTYRDLVGNKGFRAFLVTQFLGAFNDNVCRFVILFLTIQHVADQGLADNPAAVGAGVIGAVFILPFLLFSGYAGHLADVHSKQRVLVWTKGLEVATMTAMVAALMAAHAGLAWPMLAVLFLMATQSTFFSPAKYGILPEMLPPSNLSRANGLLEMSTFVAIVLGSVAGGELFERWRGDPWPTGPVLVAIAVAGHATSFRVPRTRPARPDQPFPLDPTREIRHGIFRLANDRTLFMTVVGISFFWFLGALLQLAVLPLGQNELFVGEAASTRLYTALAVGIGLGSLVAGRLSGDKIELGLVPIGGFGMAACGLLLAAAVPSYMLVALALFAIGFAGGWFAVPLHALLQQRPGETEKGRVLATNNVANTVGILLASVALYVLGERAGLQASHIIALAGVFTFGATIYALLILPDFLIRFCLWLLTHTIYRIRIEGQQHVPFRGPVLLVCNHVSHVDGFLVGACVQRFIRFLVYRPYYEMRGLHWLMRLMKVIPVAAGRSDTVASIERAREELRQGHVVCIFAEGAISRTGNLLPFKRGFERIVEGLDVPIVPVHLDKVWGSVFSFAGGRFFWKWPARIPYPVTVTFGAPLPPAAKAHQVRGAMLELGAEAVGHRISRGDLLHLRFLRAARRRPFAFALADSTGKELTYSRTLAGSLALSRWIRRHCPGEEMVGVMLPASVGGALTNVAVLMSGKVPVNLNFTAGAEAMASAVEQCGIRTVLTSKVFLKKAKLEEPPGARFLEGIMQHITPAQRLAMLAAALLLPARAIEAIFMRGDRDPDALATVIFSSGSTGTPKGVMLSHRNVLANLEGIAQVYWTTSVDRIMAALPFFHSFGFTVCLWFPLVAGFGAVYHANPMDAGTIGEMVQKYRATILLGTPTFYNAWIRKCTPEQFATLRVALAGAEKLRAPIAAAFREKYGFDIHEGYGCTEMAPVVAVNVPDHAASRQTGTKPGTVGPPLPGVAVKVVDVDTGVPLGPGAEGLLLVKGPNRMLGYLHAPAKTQEVLRDGWYITGDIATIDDEGFIRLTDRLSRFSKIGGEMVPHIRVEEEVAAILGDHACAVTAVPDETKGERLVVLHTHRDLPGDAIWMRLHESALPKLWIPKREHIYCVEAIPLLGTGKVDLKGVRVLALELSARGAEAL